jgi:hypothetical protein
MESFHDVCIQPLKPKVTKLYVNAFWNGFCDKTDANNIGIFETLFSKTKLGKLELVSNMMEADVLFESLFNSSKFNALDSINKKWKYTIYFTGEPYRTNQQHAYSVILDSEHSVANIVNFPIFVSYIETNQYLPRLLCRKPVTVVPPKFCCFIVSNGNSQPRVTMFHICSKYKQVDSYGGYNNNMGGTLKCGYHSQEYLDVLSQYKFIICFENTKKGTYITEKIVNPYLAGIIPVYWGTEYVKSIFNMDSMLYVENDSEPEMNRVLQKMIEMDNDDAKYLEMVNQPVFIIPHIYSEMFSLDKIVKEIDALL